MQKNKIDVIRAVCNNAARKLMVLSLAVAVSGGVVASATPPKMNMLDWFSTTQGEETLQERICRLEIERDELFHKANTIIDKLTYERIAESLELEQKRKNADLPSTFHIPETEWSRCPHLENADLSMAEEACRMIDAANRLNAEIASLKAQKAAFQKAAFQKALSSFRPTNMGWRPLFKIAQKNLDLKELL